MENKQDVNNTSPINTQVNIGQNSGPINLSKATRLSQKFKKLKEEVENDIKYNEFFDDFRRYNTELDGKSMPDKLSDAGFSELEIKRATKKKHLYSKKLEKYSLYQSAQLIDLELFALINMRFETYVEPMIEAGEHRSLIKRCVYEKIVEPIFEFVNQDGENDDLLNYSVDEIAGMVYFLTGKCHLNWTTYDHI